MRVLIFHGYLLRGTGSNVYNANLAAALVELGHEVSLVCQERHAEELPFVGAVGDWDSGELVVRRVGDAPCTVYRPNIGGLLPVYVADRYEGVEAVPFPELSEAQLDAYLAANVSAVQEVVARADANVALANHLVMGPAILARALSDGGVPYAVKVHGSALEYTVKPHPRFLPYAREGLDPARGVLVGSRHVAESLWATMRDESLPDRTRLGPPGVDTRRFRPRPREEAIASVHDLADRTRKATVSAADSSFSRDLSLTAEALSEIADAAGSSPLVGFVGKLIVSKGIDLLLAAWPLVLREVPAARLVIIGFGAYGPGVERWIAALASGDLAGIRALAEAGRELEGGPRARLTFVESFLQEIGNADGYLQAARGIRASVILTGRLEHDELADVLALCDALVVPSTFPEAFGMVAVEAAACGALPIVADHSGLGEVSHRLAGQLPGSMRDLISFPLGPDVVEAIAARTVTWLNASAEVRATVRSALAATAAERYSWTGVARGVIAAAQGELEALDSPT